MKAYNTSIRKYYKYTTIPNATVIGSPSINNGIASEFSTSKYLQLPTDYLKDGNTFIVKMRIANPNTLCTFFCSNSCVTIEVSNGYITTYNHKAGTRYQITTCAANTWYWVKIRLNNKTKYISYSTNGQTWTDAGSSADSAIIFGSPIRFGCGVDSSSNNYGSSASWIAEQVCTGEIDFTGCSILDSDNKEIWHGVTLEDGTAQSYDFYKDVFVSHIIKEDTRQYWKAHAFATPVLTSAKQIGGDEYAGEWVSPVVGNWYNTQGNNRYTATLTIHPSEFEPNTGYIDYCYNVDLFIVYNPIALFSGGYDIDITSSNRYGGLETTLYGSNDGNTWNLIEDFDGYTVVEESTTVHTVHVYIPPTAGTSYSYYKYFKVTGKFLTSSIPSYDVEIGFRVIAGSLYLYESYLPDGTPSDYDEITGELAYKAIKGYEKGDYYGN